MTPKRIIPPIKEKLRTLPRQDLPVRLEWHEEKNNTEKNREDIFVRNKGIFSSMTRSKITFSWRKIKAWKEIDDKIWKNLEAELIKIKNSDNQKIKR